MRRPSPALVVELAAMAAIAGLAAWLVGTATDAWLARAARLDGFHAPDPDTVRGHAHRAVLWFVLGTVVLAAGRVVGLRRARDPIAVPWLVPAALAACLLGLVVHASTVEIAHGEILLPSAAGFAEGVLLGGVVGGIVLALPVDLVEVALRARFAIAIAIAGIFIALAIAGTGPPGSGTRINLGPIQPIELVKALAIVFLAVFLGARASKLRWQRRRFLGLRWPRLELLIPAFAVLAAIVAGLYVIGDLGPVLLLALVFLGMFYLASRATGWAVAALALLAIVMLAFWLRPELAGGGTLQTRLRMWHDPWGNGLPNGHQLGEGLWAIAAGGTHGQGLGEHAVPIVPAGKTDLVLATMAEQLGLVGMIAYQLLVVAIGLGALRVARAARTTERTLIAGGVAILVVVQWLVIQAGTLGQLPLTGIVVPFVSAGRTSMVVFVGIVALVARLAADGWPREKSEELAEVQAGTRGVAAVAGIAAAAAIVAGVSAAVVGREGTTARTIAVQLADGTPIDRTNPRLVAMAARIRRGTVADRAGRPLAISDTLGHRRYPAGAALGTLLGFAPSRVLLPPWALERALDERVRPPQPARLAALLELARADRDRELAALDADVAARSVRITIDVELQQRIAALLAKARGTRLAIAAAVIDADTGQLLARVQVPDYDPSKPDWEARVLARDGAFVSRFHGAYGEWPDKTGVAGMFQTGSVGKLFTALAAARAGQAATRFDCTRRDAQGPLFTRPGWPRPIHDFSGDRTHGTIGLVDALAVSCNVYFGQLGLALGPEPFEALRAAGVDAGYGDALAVGAAGSRQLASTAYGQGAMVMNVVQAARLVAAIAAGGRYRRCPPTMALDAACTEMFVIDDPAALRPIVAGMRRVMTAGTGAALREPAGLRVYGKTGTADVRGFAGEEPFGIARGQAARPHSWFAAFAEATSAPEDAVARRGRIAVVVVVPRGGTGAAAAGPIAMQIFDAARQLGYLR